MRAAAMRRGCTSQQSSTLIGRRWLIRSEARIDRLALERQDAEHALVHPSQRLPLYESFETFDAERELTQGQRPLSGQPALTEPLEVFGQRVLGPVDDPEILPAAAFDRR